MSPIIYFWNKRQIERLRLLSNDLKWINLKLLLGPYKQIYLVERYSHSEVWTVLCFSFKLCWKNLPPCELITLLWNLCCCHYHHPSLIMTWLILWIFPPLLASSFDALWKKCQEEEVRSYSARAHLSQQHWVNGALHCWILGMTGFAATLPELFCL